jgi:hypothetical protein
VPDGFAKRECSSHGIPRSFEERQSAVSDRLKNAACVHLRRAADESLVPQHGSDSRIVSQHSQESAPAVEIRREHCSDDVRFPQRLKGRKVRGKALDIQLKQALRPLHVLEQVHSNLAEVNALETEILDDARSRIRHERLAAVRNCTDARGSVDTYAGIAIAIQERLCGMKPHSYSEAGFPGRLGLSQRSLSRGGGRDGVCRTLKDDEEAVPRSVYLMAAAVGEGPPQHTSVLGS